MPSWPRDLLRTGYVPCKRSGEVQGVAEGLGEGERGGASARAVRANR